MSKKVSELTKELDITLQELKDYAAKMDIEITGTSGSVDDVHAERLIRSINLIKGNKSDSASGSSRPKIKAVPVMLCQVLW
jgi:translation initiation factor IF-2